MRTATQPIRIKQRQAKTRDEDFSSMSCISQSLGAYPPTRPIHRHWSDVRTITYAGYLLKRSNHPHATLTPFPCSAEERLPPPTVNLKPKPTALEDYSSSSSSTLKPAFLLKDHVRTEESKVDSVVGEEDSSFEQTMAFASSFFGVDLGCLSQHSTSSRQNDTSASAQLRDQKREPSFQQTRRSSAPISITQQRKTLVTQQTQSDHDITADNPGDSIGEDGHLWRAKFCVLEGGVLYFYRHKSDAEAPDAHGERQQHAAQDKSDEVNFLTQSPMPRLVDNSYYSWEKFVALDSVGAVRSAEVEYGPNSFELSALDDVSEKLILRARNLEEMNEWLFQFHRAIASYVADIMDQASSAIQSMDIAHPSMPHGHRPMSIDTSPLSKNVILSSAISPRFHKSIKSVGTPQQLLSHGHGRNSLHRRRIQLSGGQKALLRPASSFQEASPMRSFPMMPMPRSASPLDASHRMVTPTPRQELRRMEAASPELSAPQSDYPETERPPPSKPGKYVPPHLRNRTAETAVATSPKESVPIGVTNMYVPPHGRTRPSATIKPNSTTKFVPPHQLRIRPPTPQNNDTYVMRHLRSDVSPMESPISFEDDEEAVVQYEFDEPEFEDEPRNVTLGGCADPNFVTGSILDDIYIPKKTSRLEKVHAVPFGYSTSSNSSDRARTLRWEIGAVSECGVRETNEDAFLIVNDLLEAFADRLGVTAPPRATLWNDDLSNHPPSLFAVLDGHCGDQAARFTAEGLIRYIHEHSLVDVVSDVGMNPDRSPERFMEILRQAVTSLDREFCHVCTEDGREWESGTTALIATIVNEDLVIGNLGDARGVLCRSVSDLELVHQLENHGWSTLPSVDVGGMAYCLWKEVTDVHRPSRDDERARIERANGWITTEREIPVGQLKRMDLLDQDVLDILRRCCSDRCQPSPKAAAPQRILEISRVCGELAVSRAIGDKDFKAEFNSPLNPSGNPMDEEHMVWDSSLFLPFPDEHNRSFVGDLVSNQPEFQALPVGEAGVRDEFLLLACDGLWDVLDADDAVRLTRELLFEKGWPAKRAANRLAELAVHLGSSDNITVIVVRFFNRE